MKKIGFALLLALYPFDGLLSTQLPIRSGNQKQGNGEGEKIGHRHGVQHTVQPEEPGQQQGKAHAEHNLPDLCGYG